MTGDARLLLLILVILTIVSLITLLSAPAFPWGSRRSPWAIGEESKSPRRPLRLRMLLLPLQRSSTRLDLAWFRTSVRDSGHLL